MTGNHRDKKPQAISPSKKALILELARDLHKPKLTAAEIEQIRRQLIARLGPQGKTGSDYILSVLKEAGMRVAFSTRTDTEDLYEEEFEDLLHFSTLEEAEMCLIRLDELLRKFLTEGERAPAERSTWGEKPSSDNHPLGRKCIAGGLAIPISLTES